MEFLGLRLDAKTVLEGRGDHFSSLLLLLGLLVWIVGWFKDALQIEVSRIFSECSLGFNHKVKGSD